MPSHRWSRGGPRGWRPRLADRTVGLHRSHHGDEVGAEEVPRRAGVRSWLDRARSITTVQRCFLASNDYPAFMIDVAALRALRSMAALGTLARRPTSSGSRPRRCRNRSRGWNARSACPCSRPQDAGSCSPRPGRPLSTQRRMFPGTGAVRRSGSVGRGGHAARHTARGCLLDRDPRAARARPSATGDALSGPAHAHHRAGSRPGPSRSQRRYSRPCPRPRRRRAAGPFAVVLTQRHVHNRRRRCRHARRTHALARLGLPLTNADLAGHVWVTSRPARCATSGSGGCSQTRPSTPTCATWLTTSPPSCRCRLRRRHRPDPSPCSATLDRRAPLPAAAPATEARGVCRVAAQCQCQPSDPSGARGTALEPRHERSALTASADPLTDADRPDHRIDTLPNMARGRSSATAMSQSCG